jgi:hypothetical protein
MHQYLTIADTTKLASQHSIWATQMDILASKTLELCIHKGRQIDKINATLIRVNLIINP